MKLVHTAMVLSSLFIVFLSSSPVHATEVLFKGSEVGIPESFLCGGTNRPAGKYDLVALYETKPQEKTVLQVLKGEKQLCEVAGSATTVYNSYSTNKVRVFKKVNAEMQAFQIDIVLPTGVRSRISNQVFYLPLAAKN